MENHIFIYNEIGDFGNTSDDVQTQINKLPSADKLVVHLSSPGGEVFTGWTIGNLLKSSGKKVTVIIEGLCASIATYIALQADEIQMSETARFMIHNPATGIQGEEKDLKAAADQLASIKNDLVKLYKSKTGLEEDKISEMMDSETWLTPNEAKDLGFVDSIVVSTQAVAKLNSNNINKMETVKEKSKMDLAGEKFLSTIDSLISSLTPKIKNEVEEAKNVNVELEDGSMIWVESEDGELEGKSAFMIDAEGNRTEIPVAEGTHALRDGRSITVDSDGVVIGVNEVEAKTKEEDEEAKTKIEELTQANADLATANAELAAKIKAQDSEQTELTDRLEKQEAATTEVVNQLKEIKAMTAGGEPIIAKANTKPQSRTPVETENSGLGAWGKNNLKL